MLNKPNTNALGLLPASIEQKAIIQNLARFYCYDLSRTMQSESGWEFPEDGLYDNFDEYLRLDKYWQEPGCHPFIVRIQRELAGFVLVDKKTTVENTEWNMSQFYIVARFQRQGFGKKIAIETFNKFLGGWEVRQIPKNKPAIAFWRAVVKDYTQGNYIEKTTLVVKPRPHEMNVLTFNNNKK